MSFDWPDNFEFGQVTAIDANESKMMEAGKLKNGIRASLLFQTFRSEGVLQFGKMGDCKDFCCAVWGCIFCFLSLFETAYIVVSTRQSESPTILLIFLK